MSERIIIAGEPVDIPAEVVAEGRDAVAAWYRAELEERGVPYANFADAAVELPEHVVAMSDTEREVWIANEAERRADPAGHAERKAAAAAAAKAAEQAAAPAAGVMPRGRGRRPDPARTPAPPIDPAATSTSEG